jgi:phosphoribosylformylglycinamidine synthase subunit PurSL
MPARLEIMLRPELLDAEGESVRRQAREYFALEFSRVRVIQVLTFDAALTPEELEAVRAEVFTNPVTQISSYQPLAGHFDWAVWVGLRPGVRDNPRRHRAGGGGRLPGPHPGTGSSPVHFQAVSV